MRSLILVCIVAFIFASAVSGNPNDDYDKLQKDVLRWLLDPRPGAAEESFEGMREFTIKRVFRGSGLQGSTGRTGGGSKKPGSNAHVTALKRYPVFFGSPLTLTASNLSATIGSKRVTVPLGSASAATVLETGRGFIVRWHFNEHLRGRNLVSNNNQGFAVQFGPFASKNQAADCASHVIFLSPNVSKIHHFTQGSLAKSRREDARARKEGANRAAAAAVARQNSIDPLVRMFNNAGRVAGYKIEYVTDSGLAIDTPSHRIHLEATPDLADLEARPDAEDGRPPYILELRGRWVRHSGGATAKSLKLRIGERNGSSIRYSGTVYTAYEFKFQSLDRASQAAKALHKIVTLLLNKGKNQSDPRSANPISSKPAPVKIKKKPSKKISIHIKNNGKGDAECEVLIGGERRKVQMKEGESKKIHTMDRKSYVEISVKNLIFQKGNDGVSEELKVRVPDEKDRVVLTVSRRVTGSRRVLGKTLHLFGKPIVKASAE